MVHQKWWNTAISYKTQLKKRVADHGEFFTAYKEINGMLDLVKQETENIESTRKNT